MRVMNSRFSCLLLSIMLVLLAAGAAFAASPTHLWTTETGPGVVPFAIEVDSRDNIVTYGSYYSSYYHDGRLTKLSPDGSILWSVETPDVISRGVAIDRSNDDIVIIAESMDGLSGFIARLDRAGAQVWKVELTKRPYSVAVQQDGTILLGEIIGYSEAARLTKMDAAGNVIWSTLEPLPERSRYIYPLRILPSSTGIINVVYWTSNYLSWADNDVIVYDQNGAKLNEIRGFGYPTDAVLSPADGVTISGFLYCGSGCYYSLLGGPGGLSFIGYPEQFQSLVYGSDGKVIVGGYKVGENRTFLRKIGEWEYPLDRYAYDLARDSKGDIVLAGYSWIGGSAYGSVMKFRDDIATIEGAIETIGDMVVSGEIISAGVANSFTSTLENALAANGRGNAEAAANMLHAFINKLQAQSGKGISESAAARLIAATEEIIANLAVINETP